MTMTTEQALAARAGITTILRGSVDAVMAYRLSRIHRRLTEEATTFGEAQRGIFESLATDGKVPPEKRGEFERQNRELLDVEIDVEITPIPLEELTAAVVDTEHVIPGEAWVQIEPIVSGIPE